jgi:bacterioferritin-associated ferredoxin
MIICHCRGVTEQDIVEAVKENKLEQMYKTLAPGSGCGTCMHIVRDIIEEEADKLGADATLREEY